MIIKCLSKDFHVEFLRVGIDPTLTLNQTHPFIGVTLMSMFETNWPNIEGVNLKRSEELPDKNPNTLIPSDKRIAELSKWTDQRHVTIKEKVVNFLLFTAILKVLPIKTPSDYSNQTISLSNPTREDCFSLLDSEGYLSIQLTNKSASPWWILRFIIRLSTEGSSSTNL